MACRGVPVAFSTEIDIVIYAKTTQKRPTAINLSTIVPATYIYTSTILVQIYVLKICASQLSTICAQNHALN